MASIKRWSEYIQELFQDDKGGETNKTSTKSIDGPKILQSEVRIAINKIKRNKAKGHNDVLIEMVQALGDFGTEKLTKMANAIYATGKFLKTFQN